MRNLRKAVHSREHRATPFGVPRTKIRRQCEYPLRIGAVWSKSLEINQRIRS